MSVNQAELDKWEQIGREWLDGRPIQEFNGFKLNPRQQEFVNDKSRACLIYGGFAGGKTLAFIVKLWMLCMMFPGNRILLGRKTRADVESAVLQDILDVFPEGSYKHKVGPGILEFANGSQILFYGLDSMQSGNAQEMKKSIQKIKGLNLGGVFIDQLEEIEFPVWKHLTGRLRRNVPFQTMCATTNPANHWSYKYFLKKKDPEHGMDLENVHAVRTTMLDNRLNLSDAFIEDQLSRDEIYKKTYVYGEWDDTTMVDGMVFDRQYIDQLEERTRKPLRELDGIKIYVEPTNHDYQIGVDPSTGSGKDPCHISVVDKTTGEVVATYSGMIIIEVQCKKTLQLATMYSLNSQPLVIPERNGVGESFIDQFKKMYDNIYVQSIGGQRKERQTNKLGWWQARTTKGSLIEHFKSLLSKSFPVIPEKDVVEEFRTFIHSPDARNNGYGAAPNCHDDKVMATLLAYWEVDGQRKPAQHSTEEFQIYSSNYD